MSNVFIGKIERALGEDCKIFSVTNRLDIATCDGRTFKMMADTPSGYHSITRDLKSSSKEEIMSEVRKAFGY